MTVNLRTDGASLPIRLAPRAWWAGKYQLPRRANWTAVTSLIAVARDGAIAVDIGCGVRPFDEALRVRGYRPVGLDLTAGLADVRATIERLPFGDACIDLALCVNVLQYIDHPLTACQEAFRVLRPGGRFVLCLPAVSPFDRLDRWRWTRFSAEHLMRSAGFDGIRVFTAGATALNLVHLTTLGLRQTVPALGMLLGAVLASVPSSLLATGDGRLPVGYALSGKKPEGTRRP